MADDVIAGRYRLLEPLGRGAMSSVWLAEDTELARRVAVKMLGPAADRNRFEREARAVAALSDAHVCAVYDYGEAEGRPFMVLEYLPNGSLEDRLQAGRPLGDGETRRIAAEIAVGLAHAHARGLVHRDLKPANVMFDTEERAKIADFGIARLGDSGSLTEAGTVLGTASYISPEQASGLPAGPPSDVYSFGAILFRMLTGRLPFVGTNAMDVVRMHRDERPPAPESIRADAPPALAALASRCLAKDPAGRPADGAALLRELRGEHGAGTTLFGPPAQGADVTQVIERAPPPRRRTRALPLAALAVALLGGGVALALVTTRGASDGGTKTPPSLSLPTVSTAGPATRQATTEPTTAAAVPTTTPATTTEPPATTTAPAATSRTTATTTTRPATVPTVLPTTTVAPTATASITTDTIPITTDTTITVPTAAAP